MRHPFELVHVGKRLWVFVPLYLATLLAMGVLQHTGEKLRTEAAPKSTTIGRSAQGRCNGSAVERKLFHDGTKKQVGCFLKLKPGHLGSCNNNLLSMDERDEWKIPCPNHQHLFIGFLTLL